MYDVRFPLNRLKMRWVRVAALLAAAAQLALAFAPIAEGRAGVDASAHVEEYGTRSHQAHHEADCAACTATHLLSRVERPSTLVPPALRQHWAVTPAPARHVSSDYFSLHTSRAPPFVV